MFSATLRNVFIYKLVNLVTSELLNGRVNLYGHDERLNDGL